MLKKLSSILLAVALVMTMSVTAFAATFTPSVVNKPAPQVVPQTDSSGNQCAAIIYDAAGREVASIPLGALTVTPVSSTSAPSSEILEKLQAAYQQLLSTRNLANLSSDLENVIREVSSDLTVDDLVVRDLFDVTISGAYADYLSREGYSISIRFNLSTDPDFLAAVLHNTGGTTWETIHNSRITRNADNTVDIVFYSLSPVAFLFDAGQLGIDPNGPDSPQTGEPSYTMVWIAAGVILTLALTYGVVKKHSSRKA